MLTPEELEIVKRLIKSGENIWKHDDFQPIRIKIRDQLKLIGGEICCYCQRDLTDEFNFVIDIEHVLPHSKYGRYKLSPFNLSLSCKRCNMEIKNNDTSFLVVAASTKVLAQDSTNYLFIHPNLDMQGDHLLRMVEQLGDIRVVKYIVVGNSDKGKYTVEYFELEKFERNGLDEAQGILASRPTISSLIADDEAEELEELFDEQQHAGAAPDTTAPFA